MNFKIKTENNQHFIKLFPLKIKSSMFFLFNNPTAYFALNIKHYFLFKITSVFHQLSFNFSANEEQTKRSLDKLTNERFDYQGVNFSKNKN